MSQQFPRSFDSVRAAVVAFMRQSDPHMEKLKDRQLLKEEINRLTGGSANLGTGIKNTGIKRVIDDLGRLVIPMEMRRTMGIDNGTPLEIFFDDDAKTVVLQKYNMHTCSLCGEEDMSRLTEIKRKHVCEDCIAELFQTGGNE